MRGELYCQQCGIELDGGNVISLRGRSEMLCRSCSSSKAGERWVAVILAVGVVLMLVGALFDWFWR